MFEYIYVYILYRKGCILFWSYWKLLLRTSWTRYKNEEKNYFQDGALHLRINTRPTISKILNEEHVDSQLDTLIFKINI